MKNFTFLENFPNADKLFLCDMTVDATYWRLGRLHCQFYSWPCLKSGFIKINELMRN